MKFSSFGASAATALATFAVPVLALAHDGEAEAGGMIDTLITVGFWVSGIVFLVASIIIGLAWMKVGKSALRTVLTYLFIGTVTFFIITIFQNLGAEHFGISDESMDFWWHVMFYLAMASFFLGLSALKKLGTDAMPKGAGVWGIFSAIVLVLVFVLPASLESMVTSYMMSPLGSFGLHHFIAFAAGATVAGYLFSIRKNLGMIGKAIANPMLIGVLALGLQHFWELLTESWKVIPLESIQIEGVEKIFLIIAAISFTFAALRLKSFAKAQQ